MPLSETILVLMFLLAVGMIVAGAFKKLPIPYTVLLVCVGLILSELSGQWTALHSLAQFQLTPDIVLFIFLPTLIFESGFNLHARQLIKDIAPVLALAVPALLFSTCVVGFGMWWLLPIELPVALVFGALISATDPVAVVALFKELGTPQRLTVLVEGESLLNDATAIVIFNILLGIAIYGGFTWADAGLAVGEFLQVFIGGVLVGVFLGLLVSWLMIRLNAGTSATLTLSLVLAYSSFILAEHTLHLSGVMAVVGAAVTLGGFGVPRLAHATVEALREIWEFLALICNTLLFIMIGMSVNLSSLLSNIEYILFAVMLIMAARASMIYTLVPTATRIFQLPKVTLGERHIMWWGGLKGGLAIAIVLSIPETLPGRALLLDLTLGVVLFTLLINAPTIRPIIRYLGIDRLTDDEQIELKKNLDRAQLTLEDSLQAFRKAGLLSKASYHRITQQLLPILQHDPIEISDTQTFRRHQLKLLQIERNALEKLYKAGVIPSYTFLDLVGELTRALDHIQHPERRVSEAGAKRRQNPFLRLEDNIIAWLREKDWAAAFLSRYQNHRLYQHLVKDIAHIMMCEAVLTVLQENQELSDDHRQRLKKHIRSRLGLFKDGISELREDFPQFYENFECRVSTRAALQQMLLDTEKQMHSGVLSAKPKQQIDHRLHQQVAHLPPLSRPISVMEPKALIEMTPLFNTLSQTVLQRMADRSRMMNFLINDTIIGEGEHGDSLYVVSSGRVLVSRQEGGEKIPLAELDAGDFFGEQALLGEKIRGATVEALHACTVLRITRKDVLELATEYPEVAKCLEEVSATRRS